MVEQGCARARRRVVVGNRRGAVVKALRHPEVRDNFAHGGAQAIGSSPGQFAAYIESETGKRAKVVKAAASGRSEAVTRACTRQGA